MAEHHITFTSDATDGTFGWLCACLEEADGFATKVRALQGADEHIVSQCPCNEGWFTVMKERSGGREEDVDERCLNPQCRWSA